MQVVEPKLVAAHADVVDATSKGFHLVLNLVSGGNLALRAVLFNVGRERPGDMELVRVGVRILCLLEFLNLAAPEFVVLLLKAKLASFFEGGQRPTHIRVEIVFAGGGSGSRTGSGRGCTLSLASLGCVLRALLFSALEFAKS